jgi:hypothetical protein
MDNYTDVMFCLQVAHAAAKLREEAEMSQLAKERADAEAKKLEAAAALEREIAEAAEKGITLQICGYGKKAAQAEPIFAQVA